MLAAELIAPLVVPNSSFSSDADDAGPGQGRRRRSRRSGSRSARARSSSATARRSTATDIEKIDALGLRQTLPDVASFGGWLLLAVLVVGMLLAWIWRFRPGLWHRDNVLILIGLLVVGATLALKITAGRPTLPFFLPTAAIAMLLAILLDASLATIVIAIIAIIGGAVNGDSLEFADLHLPRRAWPASSPSAAATGCRSSSRRRVAVFVVNALVVSVFSLLGARDLRGILELWFASAASAAGSGIAAVGTFAVLGSVFGILTVFQLLELANPSQPLLRRLLVETPGHVPPLADGRQPGRARGRGDRRRSAGDPRGRLLPRCRQAREPARVHREPGRRRQHPRPARPRGQRPDPQAARRRRHRPRLQGAAARRRSSRSSRSTTGRRS